MSIRLTGLALAWLVVGCGRGAHGGAASESTAGGGALLQARNTDGTDADACGAKALGLGAAKPLAHWQPPPGCQPNVGPAPQTIRSEAEFKRAFQCQGDASSGLSFAVNDLVAAERVASPAGAGATLFDDGKTVTVVNLSRTPCGESPMPMAMPFAITALLPAHAERSFAERGCTLPSSCN
jgi:hypothetical protein